MSLYPPSRYSARSSSWIVPSHRLHLKPLATRDKSHIHHCTACKFTFYIMCTEQFVYSPLPQTPQFTIIFPPLLPTITFDFPAFTFSALSSSPFSHKLLHCWCHTYYIISIQPLGRQTLLASLETTSMPFIHTQLPQSPPHHLPRNSIKFLLQIHKNIVQLRLPCLVFL